MRHEKKRERERERERERKKKQVIMLCIQLFDELEIID